MKLQTDKRAKKQTVFSDFYSPVPATWCTNCGNYGISAALKRALVEENIMPKDVLMTFDIGCSGNGADKIEGIYRFKGLHGRSIPLAAGAHLANRKITVIASGGDGATLNEGINHLVHAVRSNYNITFLLHNNSNFALTTGQASSASPQNTPLGFAPDGMPEATINPSLFVLGLNPTFVARGFSGDIKHQAGVIRAAIKHNGFSFIEILQSCPSYNRVNTHEWYMNHVVDVKSLKDYDPKDLNGARELAQNPNGKIPIGVLYQDKKSVDFYSRLVNRVGVKTELVEE